MAWLITSRCRSRRGPEASRSHTPPPKSAPAKSTYALRESASIPARTSASVNSGTADTLGGVHPAPFGGTGAPDDLPIEEPDHDGAEEAVEQREAQEGHDETGHRRHRVGGAQGAVHDPGLASHLGHRPACLDGQKAERRPERHRAE